MPMTALEGDSTCSCGGSGAPHSVPEAALRFRPIFEHLKDGFFTVDRDWRFTYLNAAALRAFNGAPLTGQVLWQAFPDARATIFESEFQRVLKEGVTTEFEAYFPASKVWLRVAAFPFDLGLAVTIADVTELREAREQLDRVHGRDSTCGRGAGAKAEKAAPAAAPAAAAPSAAPNGESSSLRVDVHKVDQLINQVGELVITQSMLTQTASMLGIASSAASRVIRDLSAKDPVGRLRLAAQHQGDLSLIELRRVFQVSGAEPD